MEFLRDAPTIEDIVRDAVKRKFNLNVGPSEYTSWRNSLGNAMFHVINNSSIPDQAGIRVEYRVKGRKYRIDFLITGKDKNGRDSVSIIELKQWTEIDFSELQDHVKTRLGGGLSDERHPSYQAWSYARHLQDFNEFVYENQVQISSSAYLHNCEDRSVVQNSRYENFLRQAPVFMKGDIEDLRGHISKSIFEGVGIGLLEDIDASPVRPSKQLAEAVSSMLNGNEEFVLLDDQKTVLETIVNTTNRSLGGTKEVIVIKGGPGTGKSVVAINAVARLTAQRLNTQYVTQNSAPRTVYAEKLGQSSKDQNYKNLFSSAGSFVETSLDSFDALIIDESHRLNEKSGFFKNLGTNQIKEIIDSSKTSVFFIDEAQKVTWADIGEITEIEKFAQEAGANIKHLELKSQFRCSGSDDYLAWLDDALGVQPNSDHYFSTSRFDFKIIDSPTELQEIIFEKNELNNKARLVAGYCWDWVSKKDPRLNDIVFPEFKFAMKWNLASYAMKWIIEKDSVNEIGCIHTCQGLEMDYVGVVVGKDLIYRDGELTTDPTARAKTDGSLKGYKKFRKENSAEADVRADEIIRNTYRTLMTRGMKGCYVYFADKATGDYFKSLIPKN
jgi:DUF2075 family protein